MDISIEGRGVAGKEPWIAVILSSFVWGGGQLYAGCIRKGCVLIFSMIIAFSACIILVFGPIDDVAVIVTVFILFYIIHIWNLFNAYFSAAKRNSEEFELARKSVKDPWLAVFLSIFFAGLGHFYLKKYLWGITFIILSLVISYFGDEYRHIGKVGSVLFVAFVCFHAYVSSQVKREKTKKQITAIAGMILLLELLKYSSGMICIEYLIQAYSVPLNSMSPAVIENDRVLVQKSFYDLKLGDVIVFKHPEDKSVPYLKRIMALGGDSVEIIDGSVFINGKKIDCQSCPDISYSSQGKYGTEGGAYKVPEGSYYVLGDNSENSYDSRAFGAIPEEDVIGKAYKIYWPLNRFGLIK